MTKKPVQKLSLKDYISTKEKQRKKFFRFYPWPVTVTLLIPFTIFFMLIALYFIHVKRAGG